eukprot:COSAG01_NODE_6022_length_3896_cov_3.470371_4_plen_144_part_00
MAANTSEANLLRLPEADMRELLKDELGMKVMARNAVMDEWRALKAKSVVITVQARFVAFLERVGGSAALQGLEHVPVSTLPEALSFIRGKGSPTQAELRLGVQRAYAKIDALLALGPDKWNLTRDAQLRVAKMLLTPLHLAPA